MKKFILITLVIILISGFLLSSCTQPSSTATPAKPIELKMSSWTPPPSTPNTFVMEPWIKQVQEASGGKLHITHYTGGSLGAQFDHYNLCVTGQADIVLEGCEEGVVPVSKILFQPFLWDSAEVAAMVSWRLAEKYLMKTDYKDLHLLYYLPTTPVVLF